MNNLSSKNEPLLATVEDVFPVQRQKQARAISISVKKGILKVGDKVEFVDEEGNAKEVIIDSIEIFRKSLTELRTGGRAQIFFDNQYIEAIRDKLKKGCIFRSIGAQFKFITEFEAEVWMQDMDIKFRKYFNPILFDGSRANFLIGHREVSGNIMLKNNMHMLLPGDKSIITVKLAKGVFTEEAEIFSIYKEGMSNLVAEAIITKI